MKASSRPKPKHFRTWLHEPFLERASDTERGEGRYALGAFLTLRLADRFRAGEDPGHPLALAYQTKATRDYLMSLEPETPEVGHLLEIVRLAEAIQQGGTRDLLWAPLLAYGFWLEERLNLTEALDVVETALGLADGTAPDKEIAGLLQHGRVLRLLGLFDLARKSYRAARKKAAAVGDTHSVLLGRIGDAIVMRQVGNLRASERALRKILKEARAAGDRDAEARARHDLGAVYNDMGRAHQAIAHLYKAFELYERHAHKIRALSDVGEALKQEGRYQAARDAFMLVLAGQPQEEMRVCTMIALLELSGRMGDRVGFARWRREISAVVGELPAERAADFHLQLGIAAAAFGQRRAAERALRHALRIADEHHLHHYGARARAALAGMRKRGAPEAAADASGAKASAVFLRIERKLHALRAS